MNHSYKEFEGTRLWVVVKDTLDKLKTNQDIMITTRDEYVIGFICKNLEKSKLVLFREDK